MADDAVLPGPRDDELFVVVGPTASGKTALAIELAQRHGGEIVSADSIQIYRRFELGTGKPSPEERAAVRHHLIDALEPDEPMDASQFVERADESIAEIRSRGHHPIVCGGTFLWVKALLYGLAPMPRADPELRARHQAWAEAEGRAALHARLADVDPDAAARLEPNDLIRVSRALEVYELTGKTQTALHAEHRFADDRYRFRLLGVERAREALDERIRARVRGWLEAGWVDEVRALIAAGYEDTRPMGAVGFRQIRSHLAGELPAPELEDAIVRATRTLVRRQRTWLRSEAVRWLSPRGPRRTSSSCGGQAS